MRPIASSLRREKFKTISNPSKIPSQAVNSWYVA
jgi:hypothetical protein